MNAIPRKARRKRINLGLMALEPRWMFDGAALVDAAHAAPDAAAKALIPDAPAPVQVRAADASQDGGKKEVLFIDTTLANYQALEAAVKPGIEIEEIDGGQSGLAQMAKWAETHTGYDSISVVFPGAEATLNIGTDALTDTDLSTPVRQAELAAVGSALKAGGDLMLYGSDVAVGSDGQTFIADIAAATGAKVAASDSPIGLAGNWTLDQRTGATDATAFAAPDYAGDLYIAPTEIRAADPALNGGKLEVVFVDTSVVDYQTLEAAVGPGVGIVEINGSRSGLEQMTVWAETHSGYDSISVLSHGGQAQLNLGSDIITDASLSSASVKAELAGIGAALKSGGDLLVYGCDVALGADGRQFVTDLATDTGVAVGAATHVIGVDGGWTLDYATGAITSGDAFNAAALDRYSHDLANFSSNVYSSSQGTGAHASSVYVNVANVAFYSTDNSHPWYMEVRVTGTTNSYDSGYVTIASGTISGFPPGGIYTNLDGYIGGPPTSGSYHVTTNVYVNGVLVFNQGQVTITYTANSAPSFAGGSTSMSMAHDSGATSLLPNLHVTDTDSGQTETWSVTGAPSNGTITFTGSASASTATQTSGTNVAPTATDITYTPNAGFVGTDSVTFQVSDGAATTSRTISFTVQGLSVTGGSANQTVNDSGTGTPLSGVTVADNAGSDGNVVVTLTVKGGTSLGDLGNVSGWTAGTSGSDKTYTKTFADAATANAAVQATTWVPVAHIAAVGTSSATTEIDVQAVSGGITVTDTTNTVKTAYVNTTPIKTAGGGNTVVSGNGAVVTIDSSLAFNDPDYNTSTSTAVGNWNGGSLDVAITAGADGANDRLAIQNTGGGITTTGGTTVAGNLVYFNGTQIGTIAGGADGAPGNHLTVNLIAAATSSGVSALAEAIRFSSSASATMGDRTVQITATDGSSSTVSASDTVTVANGPIFNSGTTANFAENATGTVYTAAASASGGSVSYGALTGVDASKFNFDTTTGILTFKTPPDYEVPASAASSNVYNVTISATDSNGTHTRNVAITVTNVAPAWTAPAPISLADNATNGATVATLASTGDTSSVTWSIQGGNGTGLFAINAATGAITVADATQFAGTQTYTLAVREADGTTNADHNVTVNVGHANRAPTITSGSVGTVQTGQSAAVSGLSVADSDAGNANVTVTATTTLGNLTFGGNSGTSVSLTGTISQVNTALTGMMFAAGQQSGAATITVTINDLGNTGTGGAKTASTTISASVNAPPPSVPPVPPRDSGTGDGGTGGGGTGGTGTGGSGGSGSGGLGGGGTGTGGTGTGGWSGGGNGFGTGGTGMGGTGTGGIGAGGTGAGGTGTGGTGTGGIGTGGTGAGGTGAGGEGGNGSGTGGTGTGGTGTGGIGTGGIGTGGTGAGGTGTGGTGTGGIGAGGTGAGGTGTGGTGTGDGGAIAGSRTGGGVGAAGDGGKGIGGSGTGIAGAAANVAVQAPAAVSLAPTSQMTVASGDSSVRVPVVAASQRGSIAGDGPVTIRPLAQVQAADTGAGIVFSLPVDTFAHTRADAVVSLKAAQPDGQPLPAWLTFDSRTGTFTGKPPAGFDGVVTVRVVASDQNGQEAVATVQIRVGQQGAAPVPVEGGGQSGDAAPAHGSKVVKLSELRPGKPAFTQQLKLAGRNAGHVRIAALAARIARS